MLNRSDLLKRIDAALQTTFRRCPRISVPLIVAFLAGVLLCTAVAHGETLDATTPGAPGLTGFCALETGRFPTKPTWSVGRCAFAGVQVEAGKLVVNGALTIHMTPAEDRPASNARQSVTMWAEDARNSPPLIRLFIHGFNGPYIQVVLIPTTPEEQAAVKAESGRVFFNRSAGVRVEHDRRTSTTTLTLSDWGI